LNAAEPITFVVQLPDMFSRQYSNDWKRLKLKLKSVSIGYDFAVHTCKEENCVIKLKGLGAIETAPRMPHKNHTEPSCPARSDDSSTVSVCIRIRMGKAR
jgi:hypothetical protein